MTKITQEMIDYMIYSYVTVRKNTKEIAKELHISAVTVGFYLKSNNVEITRFRYKFNDRYFENINTPNKAYFLGLLYADGSINTKKNSCKITLTEKDSYILESLRKEVETKKPLAYGKSKPIKNTKYIGKAYYSLELNSEKLINDLEGKGITANKSQILKFPTEEQVPLDKLSHFIRGYIDGDECIYASQNRIMINIVSSEWFLKDLSIFLSKELNINANHKKDKRSNSWYMFITRISEVLRFCEYIYSDDNCIKLLRKYEKFKNFKNMKEVEEHFKKKGLLI
jgi:hypothetical protein